MSIAKAFKGSAPIAHYWRQKSFSSRPWQLRWKPVCASTEKSLSEWLKEKPFSDNQPRAVFAARQNHGKGQFGRFWQSPIGGVWVSAALPSIAHVQAPGLLGLAVAVALAQRLEVYGVPIRIKWPNDLMVEERKLAGFLPRLLHRGSKLRFGRIGVGLNACNRVPLEGISLIQILKIGKFQPDFWAAEVLMALDESIDLLSRPDWICRQVERRLWKNEFMVPETRELWEIKGITAEGALELMKGTDTKIVSRWD